MSLPADISTCALTFGPYTDATGAPLFAGMVGLLTPSTAVLDRATGAVISAVPVKVTLDATGSATVVLPTTSQTTTSPPSWTYAMAWQVSRFDYSPGNKTFVLPSTGTVDYDALVLSASGVYAPGSPAPTPTPTPTATTALVGSALVGTATVG